MTDRTGLSGSPAEDRARRRVLVTRTLRRALAELDASNALTAAQLGVGKPLLDKWLDEESPNQISYADVLGLPPVARATMARLLEETHFEAPGSDLRLLATLTGQLTELVSETVHAAADCYWSPSEVRSLEHLCLVAANAIATLEARLREAHAGQPIRGLDVVEGGR